MKSNTHAHMNTRKHAHMNIRTHAHTYTQAHMCVWEHVFACILLLLLLLMLLLITDNAGGSANVILLYNKGRIEVNLADFRCFPIPVISNKSYQIKLSATVKGRLVLVVKAFERPWLWDFYGGERISKNAVLLVTDFAATHLKAMNRTSTAAGLEYVAEDANSTTVSLLGKLRSSTENAMLYIVLMPVVYDNILCARCRARSNGPCGFCSAKKTESEHPELLMNVTVVRYIAEVGRGEWSNDGCEVRLVYLFHTI